MLKLLDLAPGASLLEIGAGTGYNAALMAQIVGEQRLVVTLDVLDDVVAQTRRLLARAGYAGIAVLLRDGVEGAAEQALFDRIVATVGCSDLSPRWAEQLAQGGRMLVPLDHAGGYPLFLIHKERGRLAGRVVSWTGFMPVRGPLHVDGLWPMGVAQPDHDELVHQRDPWPGFAAAGPLPGRGCSADESDFGFYLSLADRRACWGLGGVGLGRRRSRRHPLVEGRRAGRGPRSPARCVALAWPPCACGLPGGVRAHRGGLQSAAQGLGGRSPLLPRARLGSTPPDLPAWRVEPQASGMPIVLIVHPVRAWVGLRAGVGRRGPGPGRGRRRPGG
jgi:protein-L-isoaspartate O-methyltransferase